MSSRSVRSYRRRKTNLELDDLDLNRLPLEEISQEEGEGPSDPPLVPIVDVEDIDDDVIESSPRSFAQAKTNSRRNRRRTIVDVDLEDQTTATNNGNNICVQDRPMQPIINCGLYINLEGISHSMNENTRKSPEPKKELPEPPKPPVFDCPICMAPLVEEMSTRCGHIFCKKCIKAAISKQGKCPTCRKKVTARALIRVFLPSAS